MTRTFSIATLLLIMAIAAVAMGGVRGVWVRIEEGAGAMIVVPLAAGAFAGAVNGAALGYWNSPRGLFAWQTWLRAQASSAGGALLGAAVGAQVTAPVGWFTLLFAPLVVVGLAALVVINGRRHTQPMQLATEPSGRQFAAGNGPSTGEPDALRVPASKDLPQTPDDLQ